MSGALSKLVRALDAEFERDVRGPRAAAELSDYALRHDDWRSYAFFDPSTYTRNLVARREHFELLVLAWNAGQSSPIHNHSGQQCWMAVLDGEIEEQQFDAPHPTSRKPLTPTRSMCFEAGKVAYINDEIALHLVRPRAGAPGVSLHLYSRPFETCNVYDEATGQVVVRKLVYYSVDGRKLSAAAP